MVEKKEIKTKGEIEKEKAEGKVGIEKKAGEMKGKMEEKTGEMKKEIERRKNPAQKLFEDMLSAFRERQSDFEKAVAEYSITTPKMPMIDVIETDTDIIIKADFPGVKKEDIHIELTEDAIEIGAKFEEEMEVKEENYIRKERKYGEARRAMTLPELIKVEEASAKFENGVLTINLPKEMKKRHRVQVE